MNPFKREQHLDDQHPDQVESAIAAGASETLDSDEARALHRYFHQGDFVQVGHDHPEGEY